MKIHSSRSYIRDHFVLELKSTLKIVEWFYSQKSDSNHYFGVDSTILSVDFQSKTKWSLITTPKRVDFHSTALREYVMYSLCLFPYFVITRRANCFCFLPLLGKRLLRLIWIWKKNNLNLKRLIKIMILGYLISVASQCNEQFNYVFRFKNANNQSDDCNDNSYLFEINITKKITAIFLSCSLRILWLVSDLSKAIETNVARVTMEVIYHIGRGSNWSPGASYRGTT